MLGIVLLLDRKNMPSLRKAYDLWLYDRPLFWQRLKANLNRGTHSPLSFFARQRFPSTGYPARLSPVYGKGALPCGL